MSDQTGQPEQSHMLTSISVGAPLDGAPHYRLEDVLAAVAYRKELQLSKASDPLSLPGIAHALSGCPPGYLVSFKPCANPFTGSIYGSIANFHSPGRTHTPLGPLDPVSFASEFRSCRTEHDSSWNVANWALEVGPESEMIDAHMNTTEMDDTAVNDSKIDSEAECSDDNEQADPDPIATCAHAIMRGPRSPRSIHQGWRHAQGFRPPPIYINTTVCIHATMLGYAATASPTSSTTPFPHTSMRSSGPVASLSLVSTSQRSCRLDNVNW